MSHEKATAAKRTAKKVVAVTQAPKSKRRTTAVMMKSAARKKTVSNASADVAPAPTKVVSKAGPGRKAATTKLEGEVKQTPPATKKLMEKPAEPSKEERQRWIATAAYHRAEKRGFAPGYEVQDWLDAEAEINELIGQARSK